MSPHQSLPASSHRLTGLAPRCAYTLATTLGLCSHRAAEPPRLPYSAIALSAFLASRLWLGRVAPLHKTMSRSLCLVVPSWEPSASAAGDNLPPNFHTYETFPQCKSRKDKAQSRSPPATPCAPHVVSPCRSPH